MRILFALPGLHRLDRGAEIAFLSIAEELAVCGENVTLIGSGPKRDGAPYAYLQAPSVDRTRFERFPKFPLLRHEYAWEELTFAPALLARYRPADYDVTVTCSYPFTNWILRRPALSGAKPRHVFVTQNGDWPPQQSRAEYRYFGCDGLVCTNPDYYERNKTRWNCSLIPNGVDVERFRPGAPQREAFGLPNDRTIVLMVSALIDSKRVEAGITAVSALPDAHLVVAGAGPLRQQLIDRAAQALPGRFTLLTVPAARMPDLYRSADVFLHLSLEEAFGNVFIEALACGLPVVGHDTPRLRWIVGEEGFLTDTREAAAIARAIAEAASAAPQGRERRVERASQFSWTRVAGLYREFLRSVVAQSPAKDGAALAQQHG
jgi:glycosyltransferase involved in cell wall biosynthesis